MKGNQPPQSTPAQLEFISEGHVTKLIGRGFNVYNNESVYSDAAVRTLKLGRKEIDAFGNPVLFASVMDAEKWVKGGKVIYPEVQFGLKFSTDSEKS